MLSGLIPSYYSRRLLSLFRLLQQIAQLVRRARQNLQPLLVFVSFLRQRIRLHYKRHNPQILKPSDLDAHHETTSSQWTEPTQYLSTHDGYPTSYAASRLPSSSVSSSELSSFHTPPTHINMDTERISVNIEHPPTSVAVLPGACDSISSLRMPRDRVSSPSSQQDEENKSNTAQPMLSNECTDFWGIAPYYFKRYDRSRTVPRVYHDTKIPPLSLDHNHVAPPGWTPFEHPEGALYFHHSEKNIFTDANLNNPEILDKISRLVKSFEDFVSANCVYLDPTVELVLDLEESGEDEGRCGYYLVNHQHRLIFWLDEFETADLPDWNEVPGVTSNAHIRHELESQYWYHYELFPHTREVTQELVDELRDVITHALGDVSTSPYSTVESTVDELQVMLNSVTAAEKQVNKYSPGCICILSRLMHIRVRHRFINFHGQPSARLGRDQAIYDVSTKSQRSYLITLLSPMLFSAPEVHLRTLQSIYVDEIVYASIISKVIHKLNDEWQEFILYATVLLNANVALLAIQSVDDGGSDGYRTPVQISSYLSIAMSIGSIILGLLLVRQNRTKGKESAPEAMRFMSKHSLEILAILYSLPYALLMWAMVAFLASFAFLCFQSTDLVTRVLVGAACFAITALIVWCIWYAWESHGPNAWWQSIFETLIRWKQGTAHKERASDENKGEDKLPQHNSGVQQIPRKRPWGWATMFRVKRLSVDSQATTV